MKNTITSLAGILMLSQAQGAILLDGSRDAEYGGALATQSVQTQFGDNASELNAGYASISDGNLNLLLTGNLENNFNKLNIFIDSVSGGQNIIGGTNPSNDGWASNYNNFTFDSGFTADYMLIARNGNGGGDRFDLDLGTIGTPTSVSYGDIFGGSLTGTALDLGSTGLGVGFDNSNAAGVGGGTAAANATAANAVTTGLELIIPLALIGNPSGDIRVSAMINGSDHNYLSNQFLGGLASPQGNLGGDGAGIFTGNLSGIDLNNFVGDQFFTVSSSGVPEPSAALLAGLGLLSLIRRKR